MRTKSCLSLVASVLGLCLSSRAASFSGNGNAGFGGPIGQGSLALSDDGTTISGTLTKGPNGFNDALVLYIDSVPGGFSDTSGFADAGDGLRKAISGFDGGGNRSTLTMPTGFSADYAIALGPASDNFGGLWHLANGGNNSLGFVGSVNLNPTGNNLSASYTFSFDVGQIGLSPVSGQSFRLLGSYISNTGFRSDEALPGNVSGAQGWNPFTGTAEATYTTVPEPTSTALLFGLAALGAAFRWRRRN